jgi:UDP-2,4-diacetamido-2,4,6-trideoxy-beta-L-altropyranose hydrolase
MNASFPIMAFRVDASIQIGTGHVMRCLTLADAFAARDCACHFICRAHPGHLADTIDRRGHVVHLLPRVEPNLAGNTSSSSASEYPRTVHASWLGCTSIRDARETSEILQRIMPVGLVVDHYALARSWESALRPYVRKLVVIDDLADREHDCDVVLDQSLGHVDTTYDDLVSPACTRLVGPRFALLREEFTSLRADSLRRRVSVSWHVHQVLVTMGGIDIDDWTSRALDALDQAVLPSACRIKVVLGPTAPWIERVEQRARSMSVPTDVIVNASDMASLMAQSDFAIGAAGSTAWERCCMGLPSVMVIVAANQRLNGQSLQSAGAALLVDPAVDQKEWLYQLVEQMAVSPQLRRDMGRAAAGITEGRGALLARDEIIACCAEILQ